MSAAAGGAARAAVEDRPASPNGRLTVLVDATMLDGSPSGAATRLAALGAAHAAGGAVDVVHLVRPGLDPLPGLQCLPFGHADTPLRRGFAGRRLETVARQHGAVVVQAGALPLPHLPGIPLLLTLHDLRFLQPGVSPARRWWARHRLAPNLRRAARIVAVSAFTARELAASGLCAAADVVVVPNAGTPGLERVQDADRIAAFRRRLGLNARYVLAIGPLAAHKRPGFLLDVLAAARALPGGSDLALVLAGRLDPEATLAFGRRAEAAGLAAHVRLAGLLDAGDLAVALSGADGLLVASRTEGFAIPVVDAQRCGVPVVAVQAGALPDVVGEGGWLAPPDDAPAFAAALVAAVTPGSAQRARLGHARELAARWSWERSARALEDLWRECARPADAAHAGTQVPRR